MRGKQAKGSGFDAKKWGLFLLFIVLLAAVLLFFLTPEGENQANEMLQRARLINRNAQNAAEKTADPQDLANLDLSRDSLERAETLYIESQYSATIEEARKSMHYSEKVISGDKAGSNFGARIRFDELIGEVLVKKKVNPAFERAVSETSLGLGDLVKTSAESGCRIVFSSGLQVILNADTHLTLSEEERDGSNVRLILFLDSGKISLKTSESQTGSVLTNAGRAVLYHGTDAAVSFDADVGTMAVAVRYGRTDARSDTKSAIVGANQKLSFSSGSFSGVPEKLPVAPQLLAPSDFAKFRANSNGFASVNLQWETAPNARSYHVQLSTDSLFIRTVADLEDFRGTDQTFPALKPGVYYWRVASRSSNGVEGFASPEKSFEIVERDGQNVSSDDNPPKLKIQRKITQGYIAIIIGTTDRDANVKINGEPAPVDKETGEFVFVLKLPGQGLHDVSVAAQSSTGGLAYENFTVLVKD